MSTSHKLIVADSRVLSQIPDNTVDLVVTSPPYPMIEMWDRTFAHLNPKVSSALTDFDGNKAFSLMHDELDKVWREIVRALKPGGWACINIGDATRKIGDYFKLYSNHTRITQSFFELGMDILPVIIWKKQTNAPNKFMGSGMLPGGAYVTLEHEYILIFRKGHRRVFPNQEKKSIRRTSSYFWEERNIWFSDTWDFKGSRQAMSGNSSRRRSGAYPFVLAYRLISMYSVYGDTVLDPFLGTGTTTLAAIAAARNSIGVEIDSELARQSIDLILGSSEDANDRINDRLQNHRKFIEEYREKKGDPKHHNAFHGFPVITSQEKELELRYVSEIAQVEDLSFVVEYDAVRPISLPLFDQPR